MWYTPPLDRPYQPPFIVRRPMTARVIRRTSMSLIPSMLLRQLYTFGSLQNTADGVQFAIKNRLSDAELTELLGVAIDGASIPLSALKLDLGDGAVVTPD